VTAAGKLFLLEEGFARLRDYAKRTGLAAHTRNTLNSVVLLERELERIQRQGWATDNEEAELGVRCVAAGIRDDAGNLYFQHKDDPKRRWVIYAGNNDGSRVPPGWQSWLRGTIDELPEKGLPPRRPWEKEFIPNLTGSGDAWRPSGSLRAEGKRAATTGDYSAWTPDEG